MKPNRLLVELFTMYGYTFVVVSFIGWLLPIEGTFAQTK